MWGFHAPWIEAGVGLTGHQSLSEIPRFVARYHPSALYTNLIEPQSSSSVLSYARVYIGPQGKSFAFLTNTRWNETTGNWEQQGAFPSVVMFLPEQGVALPSLKLVWKASGTPPWAWTAWGNKDAALEIHDGTNGLWQLRLGQSVRLKDDQTGSNESGSMELGDPTTPELTLEVDPVNSIPIIKLNTSEVVVTGNYPGGTPRVSVRTTEAVMSGADGSTPPYVSVDGADVVMAGEEALVSAAGVRIKTNSVELLGDLSGSGGIVGVDNQYGSLKKKELKLDNSPILGHDSSGSIAWLDLLHFQGATHDPGSNSKLFADRIVFAWINILWDGSLTVKGAYNINHTSITPDTYGWGFAFRNAAESQDPLILVKHHGSLTRAYASSRTNAGFTIEYYDFAGAGVLRTDSDTYGPLDILLMTGPSP